LDLQYPGLCLGGRRPRCAGIHQRPPGIPTRKRRPCCPPSPCGRLSRPRTTTRTPSRLRAVSRRWACPPPAAGG